MNPSPSRTFLERAVCLLALEFPDRAVLSAVTQDWFVDSIASRAWQAISRSIVAQTPLDLAELIGQLDPEEAGALMADVPLVIEQVSSIETATRMLALAVERDRLRQAATEAIRVAGHDVPGARTLLLEAATRTVDVEAGAAAVTASDAVMAFFTDVEARRNGTAPPPLLYGYPAMDGLTLGLDAGQLVLIAARAGIGKSLLAMNLTRQWCQAGKRVLYVSLEMSAKKCTARWCAMLSGLNAQFLERGTVRQAAHWQALSLAIGQFGAWPLHLFAGNVMSLPEVVTMGRQMRATAQVDVIVVDYAGLIDNPPLNRNETQATQVGRLAKAMKNLATATGIPVVSLVQLNRESEHRNDNLPKLSDLRDSGDWEAHADVVWLLHRERTEHARLSVILAKNRDGQGEETFDLAWDAPRMLLHGIPSQAVSA